MQDTKLIYKNHFGYFPAALTKALGIYKKKVDLLLDEVNGEIFVKVKKVYS